MHAFIIKDFGDSRDVVIRLIAATITLKCQFLYELHFLGFIRSEGMIPDFHFNVSC